MEIYYYERKFHVKWDIFSPRNEHLNLWTESFLEFIFIDIQVKTEKFTGPNKVLKALSLRTGADREDCIFVLKLK